MQYNRLTIIEYEVEPTEQMKKNRSKHHKFDINNQPKRLSNYKKSSIKNKQMQQKTAIINDHIKSYFRYQQIKGMV